MRDVQGDFVRWFVDRLLAAKKRKSGTANVVKRISDETERASRREKNSPDAPPKTEKPSVGNWLDIGPDLDLDEEDDV